MRRRILRVALVAAAVATLVFGIPLVIAAQQLGILDERGETERFAADAAVQVTLAQLSGQTVVLPAPEHGTTIALYGLDNAKTSGTGPAVADETVVRARQRKDLVSVQTADTFVVAVPVAGPDGVSGVLRVYSQNPLISARFIILILSILGLAVFSFAVAAVVAARQSRRLARPLEEVAAAADRLGHGDFSVEHSPSDVAEIDRVGANLERTAARLDTILARERAFSAEASHQLRTPLTRIRLGLERSIDEPPDQARRRVEGAIEETDAMESVIHDLLALARDLPSPGVVTGLTPVLEAVTGPYRAVLAEQGRELLVRSDPQLTTRASRAAVEHIAQVLLDNAVAHGAGTVTVTSRSAHGTPVVDVTDRGPGPAPDADLFVRRPRTEPTGVRHGIGLAMARSLAEAESGRLLYTGRSDDRGTVFTLFLPPPADPASSPADPVTS